MVNAVMSPGRRRKTFLRVDGVQMARRGSLPVPDSVMGAGDCTQIGGERSRGGVRSWGGGRRAGVGLEACVGMKGLQVVPFVAFSVRFC